MERGILKKAGKSKKMLIMVVAVLIFGAALYYAFFLAAASGTVVDTTAATAAANSSFQQYKDYISNTKNGIKVLLEGEQLGEISKHDLPPKQVGSERNANPFMKTF